MNTGFLGPAVATVLTVYGIETLSALTRDSSSDWLQQYLPFTVLKLYGTIAMALPLSLSCNSTYRLRY